MKTATATLCGHCGSPVQDGYLCHEGTNDLVVLLTKLTSLVLRSDREPARTAIGLIAPGACGRYPSSRWDTPSGEVANVPRMLEESAAKLAVRSTQARLKVMRVEPPLPLDVRAAADADRIRHVVGSYATRLTGRTAEGGSWDVAVVAGWLVDQADTIRLREWAPQMLTDLARAVDKGIRSVDRQPDRHYLGMCGLWLATDDPLATRKCDGQVFATAGSPRAFCRSCRGEHDTTERRDAQEARLRTVRLTAAEIERVTTEIGKPVKRNTVTVWAARGKLADDGNGRYLVDDVLILAEQSAARRRRD